MNVTEWAHGALLRCDVGEDLLGEIAAWAARTGVGSATFSGIGAVRDAELGFFDVDTKAYERVLFPASMELVALHGNVAWREPPGGAGRVPVVHAHAVLAGRELVARGGHLFRATVSVTAEVWLVPTATLLRREIDPRFGLALLV